MHRDHSAWAREAFVEAGRVSAALLRPFLEQQWSCRHRRRRRRSRAVGPWTSYDLHARFDRTSKPQHNNQLKVYADDEGDSLGLVARSLGLRGK